jgi:hypothetical protein
MIQNLIADGTTFIGDGLRFSDIRDVKVAHAPREDFAIAPELLESPNGVSQGVMTAPV